MTCCERCFGTRLWESEGNRWTRPPKPFTQCLDCGHRMTFGAALASGFLRELADALDTPTDSKNGSSETPQPQRPQPHRPA